jgi:hypothetical protein
MTKLTRVYHPVSKWEEIAFNMWGDVDDNRAALESAVSFTGNHRLYGSYMFRVIEEWPVSCENALTDPVLNKKAWVGHAAVALALQIPEDITRKAWGLLSHEQRILANKEAARAVRKWEDAYRESRGIRQDVEAPMLFAGHS